MLLTIIRVGWLNFDENEGDDVALSRILSLPPEIVQNLFKEIDRFPRSRMRKLHYERDEETGQLSLHLGLDGAVPGLPLRSLSTREIDRVFIELATAAARSSGQHAPTLLILDGCPRIVFEGFFDFYSHHFLDPDGHFQTLLCIPSTDIDLKNLRWNGWELIQTVGKKTQRDDHSTGDMNGGLFLEGRPLASAEAQRSARVIDADIATSSAVVMNGVDRSTSI
jgi:hypothetical protein